MWQVWGGFRSSRRGGRLAAACHASSQLQLFLMLPRSIGLECSSNGGRSACWCCRKEGHRFAFSFGCHGRAWSWSLRIAAPPSTPAEFSFALFGSWGAPMHCPLVSAQLIHPPVVQHRGSGQTPGSAVSDHNPDVAGVRWVRESDKAASSPLRPPAARAPHAPARPGADAKPGSFHSCRLDRPRVHITEICRVVST